MRLKFMDVEIKLIVSVITRSSVHGGGRMKRQAHTQIKIQVRTLSGVRSGQFDVRALQAVIMKEVCNLRRSKVLECRNFDVGSRLRVASIVASVVGLAEGTMSFRVKSLAQQSFLHVSVPVVLYLVIRSPWQSSCNKGPLVAEE